MSLTALDKESTFAAIDDVGGRFVDLLRAVDDPTRPAIGVWNVAELAAHVSLFAHIYPNIARGQGSPVKDVRDMAGEWRRRVEQEPERDLTVLADRIHRGIKEFRAAVDATEWEVAVPSHGGAPVPVWSLGGLQISEFSVHGRDIAAAVGRTWSIEPEHARLAVYGHFPWMPHFLDTDKTRAARGTYRLKLRGGDEVYWRIDHGGMTINRERPPGRIDCYISAEPVAYLLAGYGRISPVRAAATGKVMAWGLKPWLALRLPSVFYRV